MNTTDKNFKLAQARAAYTAAVTKQDENDAKIKEAMQAKFDAEEAIAAGEKLETPLAEAVARTSAAYLQATRDLNAEAVEAVTEQGERDALTVLRGKPAERVDIRVEGNIATPPAAQELKPWTPKPHQEAALSAAENIKDPDAETLAQIDEVIQGAIKGTD